MRKDIQPGRNIKSRVLATLIDYGIYLAVCSSYTFYFGEPNAEGGYSTSGMAALPLLASWFLYFPIAESIRGQTLGHILTGIRVVHKSGKPIGCRQALLRRMCDPIDFSFFGLTAYLAVKYSDKQQRIGDMVARTMVIGGKAAVCQHCKEQCTLSADDELQERFICPTCGNENELSM